MRRTVLTALAASVLSLHSIARADEAMSSPKAQASTPLHGSFGVFGSMAGGHDDITLTTIRGIQGGIALTPHDWIHVSFGKGATLYDDGYAQEGSSAWEVQTAYARIICSDGDVELCAKPMIGIGYQHSEMTFLDGLVMDDPWTETVDRVFVEGRMVGRVQFSGHIGIELGLGGRAARQYDRLGLGIATTAGLDVAF